MTIDGLGKEPIFFIFLSKPCPPCFRQSLRASVPTSKTLAQRSTPCISFFYFTHEWHVTWPAFVRRKNGGWTFICDHLAIFQFYHSRGRREWASHSCGDSNMGYWRDEHTRQLPCIDISWKHSVLSQPVIRRIGFNVITGGIRTGPTLIPLGYPSH